MPELYPSAEINFSGDIESSFEKAAFIPIDQELLDTDQVEFDRSLATNLIFNGQSGYILENLHKFKDLSADQFEHLVDACFQEEDPVRATDSLKDNIFRFEDVNPIYSQIMFSDDSGFEPFPTGGNFDIGWSKAQEEWFGRHRYSEQLFGDWSAAKLGKVIGTRLRLGLETNIHDASHWLDEFQYDYRSPIWDISYIKAHSQDEGFSMEDVPYVVLNGSKLDVKLLMGIIAAPVELRQRLKLSNKQEAVEELFEETDARVVYKVLTADYEGRPLYQKPDLTPDIVRQLAAEGLQKGVYQPSNVASSLSAKEIIKNIDYILSCLPEPDNKITEQISHARKLGQARRQYIHDTTEWLLRHASSPRQRLTKVWRDRPYALADGVADNARAIEGWQAQKSLYEILTSNKEIRAEMERLEIDEAELLDESSQSVRSELSRVLGAKNTLDAMMQMAIWHREREWQNKIIPASQVVVKDETQRAWKFEVLGKDDPRGFTIGEDTGCCMTIHGNAETCIGAGYKLKNAGFMAVYDDDGNIAAQSFWYVNPERSDVLVLDNIEANKGRNIDRILGVYQKGLQSVLAGGPIKFVHLGEGQTDIGFSGLESIQPVRGIAGVYSDAQKQRLLLSLDSRAKARE
jgi:hypothetical protein